MRNILVALLALMAGPALAQSSSTPTPANTLAVAAEPIIGGAIDGYLRPGFHSFATEAVSLKVSAEALCTQPSEAALTGAQAQFKKAALAYGRIEFMRFGPLNVGDRADRLLLWPDPKGITLRQVQAALGGKDASVLSPETLRPKSVAMQGLVAAEYLLFGTGSDGLASHSDDGDFRCGYLRSTATLIAEIASTIDDEWRDTSDAGPAAEMLDPRPDGENYRSTDEVVQKLAQALSVGNETIRDQRVLPILGQAEGAPRPRSALFWRSGLVLPMIATDFAGLKAFFDAAALGPALRQAGSASTANSIAFEFDTAGKSAARVTSPIDQAVNDPTQLTQLRELVFVTQSLDTLLGQNLPNALGLASAFSLLDGD